MALVLLENIIALSLIRKIGAKIIWSISELEMLRFILKQLPILLMI